MGSKAFLLLGLLLAVVLLISSEVAARDMAQTSSDQKNGALGFTFCHLKVRLLCNFKTCTLKIAILK
jgi:hypothetical protein